MFCSRSLWFELDSWLDHFHFSYLCTVHWMLLASRIGERCSWSTRWAAHPSILLVSRLHSGARNEMPLSSHPKLIKHQLDDIDGFCSELKKFSIASCWPMVARTIDKLWSWKRDLRLENSYSWAFYSDNLCQMSLPDGNELEYTNIQEMSKQSRNDNQIFWHMIPTDFMPFTKSCRIP